MSRYWLGYSHTAWQDGFKSKLYWDSNISPHLLISGSTGGGKTVVSQLLCKQIIESMNTEEKTIYICDFKGCGDWDHIFPTENNAPNQYAEYLDCMELFNRFYDDFCLAIKEKRKQEKYLIFDEFSSFALSLDSKQFKELMVKVSHLAFMARSWKFSLIFISQQFSSKVIDTAIREQFTTRVYVSSVISTENKNMLFPGVDINKGVALPRFCGYITMPEKEIDILQVPYLKYPDNLKKLLEHKGAMLNV